MHISAAQLSVGDETVSSPQQQDISTAVEETFSVPWPRTNELFVFDRNGHHRQTKSLLTDQTLISFFYDKKMRLRQMLNKDRSLLEIR